MASNANPPFATKGGTPIQPSGGASGAHDFVKDPNGSGSQTGPGFDVTKQNRPQSEADGKGAAGLPNTQEIPAGGKILKADPPGRVTQTMAGGRAGATPTAGPFKNLK